MKQDCWQINETGFLIASEPLHSLKGFLDDAIAEHLDSTMSQLADLLETGSIRDILNKLPVYDMASLEDCYAIERAFQIYAYFASAYVYATGQPPSNHIPATIAVPLVTLAEKVQRPPILSYAPYTLANWQKIVSDDEIVVDNLALLHKFIHKRDAAWFTLIHVDIEVRAGAGIAMIAKIEDAIYHRDSEAVIKYLEVIHASLAAMMSTLQRMPEQCHPKVYYHEVRPYIFSFENIVYEGVQKFKAKPQSFVGETGAQSSIIPAFVRLMGLAHEENSMTQYLHIMQDYMPKAHRDFIRGIKPDALRKFVQQVKQTPLNQAYNHTLQQLLAFRKLHIRYAASYIANQSSDTIGTGGTEFMRWLQQLIDETEAQFLI